MSKKPSKVNEPQTPYTAKKPAKGESKKSATDDAELHRIATKIFSERKELLRKLAQ